MARRGRPRGLCARQPNGQPSRTVLARLKDAEKAGRMAETMTVLQQPHRRESADPKSQWNGTAYGRFLLPHRAVDKGEADSMYLSAETYLGVYRRWQRAKDVPDLPYEDDPAPGGHGLPTPKEQQERDDRIRALNVELGKLKLRIAVQTRLGFFAMHDAIVGGTDVLPAVAADVLFAFRLLAQEMSGPPERKRQFSISGGIIHNVDGYGPPEAAGGS